MRPSRPLAPTRKKRKMDRQLWRFCEGQLDAMYNVEFKLTRIDVIYVTCFDWSASKMKNVALS
jgi:hypothetical protein